MPNKFQIVSHNGGRFTKRTVEVTTVELQPAHGATIGYRYETSVVTTNDNDILERYDRLVDAIKGHAKWCSKLGLKV